MTADDRRRIREAIDAHKRQERARMIELSKGEGRCSECFTRIAEDPPNMDCSKCKDRVRIRRRAA